MPLAEHWHTGRMRSRRHSLMLTPYCYPTTPCVAPFIRQASRDLVVSLTKALNLNGHPVVSLPAPNGVLAVGIQLVGHLGRDLDLLRGAHALETDWATMTAQREQHWLGP